MANTYQDFASKPRSSKMILCHVEPSQRLTVFSLDSGSIYKKSVNYFVVDIKESGVSLANASSSSLSSGEWYFDPITSEIYINTSDDSDPKTKTIVVTYRFFFSNSSIDLPFDLNSGVEVNYDGRLKPISPISKDLDDEQIGVVLETSTKISLENTDGYFEDFYDILFFENKTIKIYSWSEILPLGEVKLIFDGIIQDKSISASDVRFTCKDFTHKLRLPIVTENFSESDGDVPEKFLNTPKRRLFGQFKQLQCVPIDATLDGFSLTGTVSAAATGTTMTGTGTSFLDELSPEDEIIYFAKNETIKVSIKSVESDTSATLSSSPAQSFANFQVLVSPNRPWRKKNRSWHMAGHKLREPITTISSAEQPNRFNLTAINDFFTGDLVDVGGLDNFVKRITGDTMVLEANLQTGTPAVGTVVTKNPVSKAFINGSEAFINRDWTVSNTSSDAILELNNLAEFNISPEIDISGSITFTNGSRSVTVSGLDFRNEVSSRDWIRSNDISHGTWYEILEVQENTIILRTAYAGGTVSVAAKKKNVKLIDEETIITVNCIGQERSGQWIKTASDAVKDMIENDVGFTNINTASFTESDADAPFILSYAIPFKIGGTVKPIKDVVSDINKSVFGSLVTDDNFDLKYQVLTPEKPSDLVELKDDDLISNPIITSKNEIVRKVDVRYSHFTDKFNGGSAVELYEFENDFVDDLIGSKSEMDIDVYLFNLDDATTIAQRYALYNSLSQSVIKVKGKLNLISKSLNDKLWINLDRLYKRLGNQDKRKIGIINKISHNGSDVNIEINDLGNAFNRVGNISDDAALDFTSSNNNEKIRYSYIVDEDTLTPDITSDVEVFANSVG